MNPSNRELFWQMVQVERERQNKKFPNELQQNAVSFHQWNTILCEEQGEFAREVNDHDEYKALVELAETAAVCFKIVEVYYRDKQHLLTQAFIEMCDRTTRQQSKE